MHNVMVHWLVSHQAPSSSEMNLIPFCKAGFGETTYLHTPRSLALAPHDLQRRLQPVWPQKLLLSAA